MRVQLNLNSFVKLNISALTRQCTVNKKRIVKNNMREGEIERSFYWKQLLKGTQAISIFFISKYSKDLKASLLVEKFHSELGPVGISHRGLVYSSINSNLRLLLPL